MIYKKWVAFHWQLGHKRRNMMPTKKMKIRLILWTMKSFVFLERYCNEFPSFAPFRRSIPRYPCCTEYTSIIYLPTITQNLSTVSEPFLRSSLTSSTDFSFHYKKAFEVTDVCFF